MGYLMEGPEGSANAKAQGPEHAWCVCRSARSPCGLSRGLEGESGRLRSEKIEWCALSAIERASAFTEIETGGY